MGVTEELQRLVAEHAEELATEPWPWEPERWGELVFCLVNSHRAAMRGEAFTENDATVARVVTDALVEAGLVEPGQLAESGVEGSDARTVARWVLARHAYPKEDADALLAVLSQAASVVVSSFDGYIQRFLRAKAEQMRDELADLIGPGQPLVRTGVTHWLQNVANMPLSVDDPAVRGFCADHGSSPAELEASADALGLNLAIVDDVIRLGLAAGGDDEL